MDDPTAAPGPSRRTFLYGLGTLGIAAPWPVWDPQGQGEGALQEVPPTYPRNDLERVQAVVGASHGNIESVRELVTEQPALARASWDWGFGDWETPLGAASHVGRKDIADFLIGHGARPTVFSEAMMGRVDTVRAFLSADSRLSTLLGPHGISLYRHARAGGADGQAVVDYLLETFGPDPVPFGTPGDEDVERSYGGRFTFDAVPGLHLTVGVRNEWLMIGVGDQPSSRILPVADHVFHPAGSPAVRFHFDMAEGRAAALTVRDGPHTLVGRRVADGSGSGGG